MKRSLNILLVLGALVAVVVAVAPLSATALPSPDGALRAGATMADGDDDEEESPPCHRTEFKTELVKKACADGGQFAAKDAMKRFVRDAKKSLPVGEVDCKTCHDGLAPEYGLKDDGLKRFEDWKKQLEAKSAK